MQIKRLRTDTGWQRSVPRPAFTTQTHQFLTAPKTVARVTAEGHRAPCKMTSIVNLVAELWGPWVLTSDELETWGRQKNSNHGNRAKLLLSSHPPPQFLSRGSPWPPLWLCQPQDPDPALLPFSVDGVFLCCFMQIKCRF